MTRDSVEIDAKHNYNDHLRQITRNMKEFRRHTKTNTEYNKPRNETHRVRPPNFHFWRATFLCLLLSATQNRVTKTTDMVRVLGLKRRKSLRRRLPPSQLHPSHAMPRSLFAFFISLCYRTAVQRANHYTKIDVHVYKSIPTLPVAFALLGMNSRVL